MSIIEASILGLIQGVAEFLPISSSGHLTLAEVALKLQEAPVAVNLALHMSTLLVIIIHFRHSIKSILFPIHWDYVKAIVITSVPTAIIGLGIKKGAEVVFHDSRAAMCFLFINGLGLIVLSRLLSKRKNDAVEEVSRPVAPKNTHALVIGLVQGVAALPGISRSGSTIGAARLMGIPSRHAAEYSLLASIPVIAGAALLECRDFSQLGDLKALAFGSLVAFASGWVAVSLLLKIVDKNAWKIWGVYCMALSLLYGVFLYV